MKYTLDHQKRGTELMKTLLSEAWNNATFKDMLIQNPKLAIQQVTGEKVILPESKNLILVEDQTDASVIYLNIPSKPDYNDFELSDEQLEILSGGEILLGTGIGIVVGVGLCWAVSHL